MNELLIAVLTFVGVAMFIMAVYLEALYYQESRALAKRVREAGENVPESKPEKFISAITGKLLKTLDALGSWAKPALEENPTHLRNMFLKAGIRQENAALVFLGVKILLATLLPFLFFLLKISFMPAMLSLPFLFLTILSVVIGFYLPGLWLRLKIARRKEEMFLGLPDALDLMVVCAEAGIGLDATIRKVGEEMKLHNKTLSNEFNFMSLEMQAGKQRREALKGLAMRTELEDVNNLASLLIQTERFGTSIVQTLRVYSDVMRVKRFQRAEEVAVKMPVKLLFPLIFFIFPSLFVTILGPAVIRIIRILLPIVSKN